MQLNTLYCDTQYWQLNQLDLIKLHHNSNWTYEFNMSNCPIQVIGMIKLPTLVTHHQHLPHIFSLDLIRDEVVTVLVRDEVATARGGIDPWVRDLLLQILTK